MVESKRESGRGGSLLWRVCGWILMQALDKIMAIIIFLPSSKY
jgi:hypothetical protein